MRLLLAALACALAGTAQAAEVTHVEASRDGEHYRTVVQARLSVPPQAAFAVMRDWALLPRINPSVRRAELLAATGEAELLHTVVELCVAMLCKTLDQVQVMRARPVDGGHELTAVVDPARSNLKSGRARWRFLPCGGATCLSFEAELVPDFWVPPLIGPWLIRSTMARQARITIAGIERVAGERDRP